MTPVAALLVVLSSNASALAEPKVTWEVPVGCPSHDGFLDDIAHASSATDISNVPMQIRLRASPLPNGTWDGWLILDLQGRSSVRRLNASSCAAVVSAAAVIVATMLVEPLPVPNDAPVKREQLNAPLEGHRPEHAWGSGIVGASAVGDVGSLPGRMAAGVDVSLGWSTFGRRLLIITNGGYFLPSTIDGVADGIAARFSLLTGGIHLCGSALFGRARMGGCVGLELDVIRGEASGSTNVVKPMISDDASFGGLAGLAAALPLTSRIDLTIRADVLFFVTRNTFVLNPDNTFVFRPSNMPVRLALGLELHFS